MILSRYIEHYTLETGELLLANLLWRTFLELSPENTVFWENASAQPRFEETCLPAELRQALVRNKFLLDDDFDELKFMQDKYRSGRYTSAVLGLTIAPTIDCNFACTYCYEDKKPGQMSSETEALILGYVEQHLPGKQRFSVIWYGGEPLMCKGTISRLSRNFIELSQASGVEYSAQMTTNGYLLDTPTASMLADLGHWTNIQITLDGQRLEHDHKRPTKAGKPTFERVIQNLGAAVGLLPLTLRMNVDRNNAEGCYALLEQLRNILQPALLRVYFAPIHPFGKGCRDISDAALFNNEQFTNINRSLCDRARELGFRAPDPFTRPHLQQCQAVSSHSYVVEPDGSLHKCWTEVGEDDKRVGHISKAVEMTGENSIRWLRFDPTRTLPCRECRVLPLCFGACPQRHLDGRPQEMICDQIRYGVDQDVLNSYLKTHRPELLSPAGPMPRQSPADLVQIIGCSESQRPDRKYERPTISTP
jgi:uncharacterized protein